MTKVPVETPALGERLRAIRRLRHRTLNDVAARAGVSESFLSQLERGRTSASVASLQRIAAAVNQRVEISFVPAAPKKRVA